MKKYFSLLLLSSLFAALVAYAGNEEHRKQFEETGYCANCDLSNFDLRPSIKKFNKLNKEGKAISNLKELHNVYSLCETGKISHDEAKSGKVRINLTESDLSGSNLSGCNLEKASLPYIKANNTNFKKANLKGADLAYIIAEGANFKKANLTYASLMNAVLKNANFKRADLRKAHLRWLDALHSNFKKANFEGANLYKANFWGSRVKKAKFDSFTNLKNAYIPGITGWFSWARAWWNSK